MNEAGKGKLETIFFLQSPVIDRNGILVWHKFIWITPIVGCKKVINT